MRKKFIFSALKPLLACLCLAALLTSPASLAELYKWVDDAGKIHYGDKPPENARLKKITGNVSSFSSVSVEPFVYNPGLVSKRKKSRSVVMYSTSWCGYCKKAARHFRKNKIPFTEYDIEKSARAANEYRKLRGRGVPIILIGDRRMNGFSAKTFDSIYYGQS
ncbi:MAG: glutaredoxin family protein [Gammaproteobacteria bacterium]|nr:MAG: glutaredoxin family protein [Gammaproteobacteria bacterium]